MLDHHRTARARLEEVSAIHGHDGALLATAKTRLDSHANATRPVDPGLAGRWRTEMTALQAARFERIAGSTLRDLGYEMPRRLPWVRLAASRPGLARIRRPRSARA
jgi:hypothetical protein